MVPTLCCNLKKSAGNFPTHPNAAIKVKVIFKELIGTLPKLQGIFHVLFNSKMVL